MHGAILVWLIFLSSWAADSCAYAAGMLFGRHKMTPVLSPKKTWEGAVGGVLGAFFEGVVKTDRHLIGILNSEEVLKSEE